MKNIRKASNAPDIFNKLKLFRRNNKERKGASRGESVLPVVVIRKCRCRKTSFVPLFMSKKSFWCFGYLGFSKKVGV